MKFLGRFQNPGTSCILAFHDELGPLRGCANPGAKFAWGSLYRYNCKTVCYNCKTVCYNIVHFIAYDPTLTQLRFIFSVEQSPLSVWGPGQNSPSSVDGTAYWDCVKLEVRSGSLYMCETTNVVSYRCYTS
jgi:hypothetical protein